MVSHRTKRLRPYIFYCYALLSAAPCWGHAMLKSLVSLEFQQQSVHAELQLPLDGLAGSMGRDLSGTSEAILGNSSEALSDYLEQHVRPVASDGSPWSVRAIHLSLRLRDATRYLIADLVLRPPAGMPPNAFRLNYDVITDENVSHTTLISITSDWKNGVFTAQPLLIGVLRDPVTSIVIDRSHGNAMRGLVGMMKLGVTHIAEGADHLMFLMLLLLPAPLLTAGARWGSARTPRDSIAGVLKIVSAFSVGHSLTLIAGTLGWVAPSERWVELFIAASILISAINALRPIFAGFEIWIAGVFGLVHGLAFAAALAPLKLQPYGMAVGIFGFNLGLEIMQLFIVALLMPWLIMLSGTKLYPGIRIGGALFGAAAASGWLMERSLNRTGPMTPLVQAATQYAPWFVAVLAATTVITTLVERRSAPANEPDSLPDATRHH
jgi:hypothetical protein